MAGSKRERSSLVRRFPLSSIDEVEGMFLKQLDDVPLVEYMYTHYVHHAFFALFR